MPLNPIPPTLDSVINRSEIDFRRIVRYLLAGNPFFILSAVLLLYAMRRLSFDSGLFSTELSQLIFNFSSFQVYEVVLVGTAILLARRRIWYDSTLLVFIENMFAFVPLLLVSQALLVENSMAAILCIAGATLFIGRTGTLTRFIRPLNFPARLLIFGALLLGINVAAPVLTRHLHSQLTLAKWDDLSMRLANLEWFLIGPGLVLLALLLPRKPKDAPGYFARTEFPLLTLLIWIAGTAVHFYCINFVYSLPRGELRLALTVPIIWTACWVLWVRAEDMKWSSEKFARIYEKVLLTAAVGLLIIAAASNDRGMLLALGTVNAVLFSILSVKSKDWYTLLLLVVSGAMTLATLKIGFVHRVFPHPQHQIGQMIFAAVCGLLFLRSTFSRDPRMAIVGGLISAIFSPIFFGHVREFFAVVQIGLTFMVLHSIRWNDKLDPHSKLARVVIALVWLANSGLWLFDDGAMSFWGVFLAGLAVLVTGLVARWIVGYWTHRLIPFAALVAMVMPPGFKTGEMLMRAPVGLMILLASFLLFAVGIMTALMRSRWPAQAADRRVAAEL